MPEINVTTNPLHGNNDPKSDNQINLRTDKQNDALSALKVICDRIDNITSELEGNIDNDTKGLMIEEREALYTTLAKLDDAKDPQAPYIQNAYEYQQLSKKYDISEKDMECNQQLNKDLKALGMTYQEFVDNKTPRNIVVRDENGALKTNNNRGQRAGVLLLRVLTVAALGAAVFFSGGLAIPLIGAAVPGLSATGIFGAATTGAGLGGSVLAAVGFSIGANRLKKPLNDSNSESKKIFEATRAMYLGVGDEAKKRQNNVLYLKQKNGKTPLNRIANLFNPFSAQYITNPVKSSTNEAADNKDSQDTSPTEQKSNEDPPVVKTNGALLAAQVICALAVVATVAFFTGGLGLLPMLPLLGPVLSPAAAAITSGVSTLAAIITSGTGALGVAGFSVGANAVAATIGGAALVGYAGCKSATFGNEDAINRKIEDYNRKLQNKSASLPDVTIDNGTLSKAKELMVSTIASIQEKIVNVPESDSPDDFAIESLDVIKKAWSECGEKYQREGKKDPVLERAELVAQKMSQQSAEIPKGSSPQTQIQQHADKAVSAKLAAQEANMLKKL